MKSKSKTVPGLAFACAILCVLSGAYGATPLYQWNFNHADGSNAGTGSGGTMTANVGAGATTGSFSDAGVSGNAWDHSFHSSNAHDNWWGSDVGNAAAVSGLNLSSLNQFTITMWIKRSGGNNADLLNIGSTTTPGSSSTPGISIALNGNWDNGMRVGVNGSNAWCGDLWGSGYNSNWVFVAIAYTATEWNWWSPAFGNIYFGGATQPGNAAVLTGDATTPVTVSQGLHLGGAADGPGSLALGATATAILANNGAGDSGFSGNLDDVRIYNGLLSVAEIEAVRQSAFAEQSPTVSLYWKGDVDDSWASLNWTSDIDGTVPGGALSTDGSAGVAFATTGAANLTNLLAADQNVKSIVVTAGSGPVDIGGTHNLTLGANGIWLELTAGGLSIDTSGGVILNANQIWKNKSPNALTVTSALSGTGTLTKSGLGLLRLGGDNSLHSGGMVVEQGTLALDHANALGGATTSLAMNGGTLDLNGVDVTLGALSGVSGAIIRNSSATSCSLTLDVSSNSSFACSINDGPGSGPVSLVKKGSANVTSGGACSFTGPVSIEDGRFNANYAIYGGAPTSSSLGNLQVSGRTITVTYPGTLSLTSNNIFGNQNANPSLLPEVIVNGTGVSANNYNLIGNITLNAATLSQTTSHSGNYQGYQFKGVVKVTGTTGASSIIGSGGNHLSSNTSFEVEDVTTDASEDLFVYTPLIDQSGDFGSAPGGLTKTGAGTMLLSGSSTYTGNTTVSDGTLELAASGALTFAPAANGVSNKVTGAGTVTLNGIFNINLAGANTTDGNSWTLVDVANKSYGATFDIPGFTQSADVWKMTSAGKTWTFTEATGILTVAPGNNYASWAASFPGLSDTTPGGDPDHDGIPNLMEYVIGGDPTVSSGSKLPTQSVVGSNMIFRYQRNDDSKGDTTQYVEWSADMTTWTQIPIPAATSGAVTVTENGAAPDDISVAIPLSNAVNGKLFARLRVTK